MDAPGHDPVAAEMTFLDHLGELRTRLIRILIYYAIAATICLWFAEPIFAFLRLPLCQALGEGNCSVYQRAPLEAFMVYMKAGLLSAAFLSSPAWMSEVWLFVAPGLYPHEKRIAVPLGILGGVLLIAGTLFGFFVVFPQAYGMLAQFGADDMVELRLSMADYGKLTVTLALAFGVIFETPVVLLFLTMLGVVTPQSLAQYRQYAYFGAFLISALITPTVDPLTMLMMAGPMIVLYEIGIILCRVFQAIATK